MWKRHVSSVVVTFAIAGCGKSAPPPPGNGSPTVTSNPPMPQPVRIALGDCSSDRAVQQWVSGPRPLPFAEDDVAVHHRVDQQSTPRELADHDHGPDTDRPEPTYVMKSAASQEAIANARAASRRRATEGTYDVPLVDVKFVPLEVKRHSPGNAGRYRRVLLREGSRLVEDVHYTPKVMNPLDLVWREVGWCLKKLSALEPGVGLVDLTFDQEGRVTAASASGVSGAIAACVVAAAQEIDRGPWFEWQRCAFAYGDRPIATLPATTLGGAPIDTSEISARVSRALASRNDVEVVDPEVVRVPDTVTMQQVRAALAAIERAGGDALLANADGELVHPVAFPLPPVPLASGGAWNPLASATRGAHRDAGTTPPLRLVVEKGRAQAAVEAIVNTARTHVFLKVTDDVSWGEVVVVLRAAERSNDTWSIVD